MKAMYKKPETEIKIVNTERMMNGVNVSINGSYPGGTPIDPPVGG